ncbi:MAG TPA: VIT1/CCC1 transporter family protein [Candidatus Saccharimonadales bacterium]|nr:VIT1/CCC1 transporter family protein [Candidatus Saccharimonadales bacterium]
MKAKFEQYLGQLVYGAIDGSVTTFAVVAGAAGAKLGSTVIIILGFANLIADGFSMGASAYLAAKSERDLKLSKDENHEGGETPAGDGIATFTSFVVVGFVPIIVYVVDALLGSKGDSIILFAISCFLTGAAFMAIGIVKGQMTKTNQLRAALETLLLGGIAAGLAYALGDVLGRALGGS